MTLSDCCEQDEVPRVETEVRKSLIASSTSLASMESLLIPVVQVLVLQADLQCPQCQKRVAEVISKTDEMESVVVNVSDKTVTVTSRYRPVQQTTRHVGAICRRPPGKISFFRQLLSFPNR